MVDRPSTGLPEACARSQPEGDGVRVDPGEIPSAVSVSGPTRSGGDVGRQVHRSSSLCSTTRTCARDLTGGGVTGWTPFGVRTVGVRVALDREPQQLGQEVDHVLPDSWRGRYPTLGPEGSEPTIQKRASDALEGTDLHARLQGIGARSVVVAGIQTEHCVAATCRGALRLGYTVHLAEDGHSTWPDEPRSADDIMAAESAALEADGVTLHSTEHLLELLRTRRSVDP